MFVLIHPDQAFGIETESGGLFLEAPAAYEPERIDIDAFFFDCRGARAHGSGRYAAHIGVVAARGEGAEPVPLDDVAGNRKIVPLDHPWIDSARRVGTSMGDF